MSGINDFFFHINKLLEDFRRLAKSSSTAVRKNRITTCAVVIPVFNEKNNLKLIIDELDRAFSLIQNVDYKILFVNDGSLDKSWEVIQILAQSNKKICGIDLSRNFGKEKALSAGLKTAENHDLVICMDADLQHPPSKIPEMVQLWRSGFEMVIGVRIKTDNEALIRKIGSKLFYKIMNSISDLDTRPSSTDFRLFDNKVVTAINKLDEKDRLFRGLADWVGFKKTVIKFSAEQRSSGVSTFTFKNLISLALTSFVSFSLWPLKIISLIGLLITATSTILIAVLIIDSFSYQKISASPLAFGIVSIIFALGIIIFILGIISLYLSKVIEEVRNRPNYIIRERTPSAK